MSKFFKSKIEDALWLFFKKDKDGARATTFDNKDPVERMRHAFDNGDKPEMKFGDEPLESIRTAGL